MSTQFPPHFGVFMSVRLADTPHPMSARDALESARTYVLAMLPSLTLSGCEDVLDADYRLWNEMSLESLRQYEMVWMRDLREEAKKAHPSNG
jgi:hypothetical protein